MTQRAGHLEGYRGVAGLGAAGAESGVGRLEDGEDGWGLAVLLFWAGAVTLCEATGTGADGRTFKHSLFSLSVEVPHQQARLGLSKVEVYVTLMVSWEKTRSSFVGNPKPAPHCALAVPADRNEGMMSSVSNTRRR